MLNLVLFGPPGAGKGTQSEKILSHYALIHFSTGALLRHEIKMNTNLGIKAKEYMEFGNLVPDDLVIRLVESKIDANLDAKGFIFDGFPRNIVQAEALDRILATRNIPISVTLALNVSDSELRNRLSLRAQEGRKDDQDMSVIENRIDIYNKITTPLTDYYERQGKLFLIDGMHTIDEIFGEIQGTIDNIKLL